jgi:hypothetical protein
MGDMIDMVQIQRDELKMALRELYDSLRFGVLNGMLADKCQRTPGNDSEKKCKRGKTRRDVQLCLGSCCEGCDPLAGCNLSIAEYDVFVAMNRAKAVLKKQPAEMPAVRPEDFPHYEDGVVYNPSARWIARQLYRFAVGYWIFANHSDKEQEKDWERAYHDILSISLRDKGSVFRKMTEAVSKIKDPEEIRKWVDENKDVVDLMDEAAKSINEPVNGENDVGWLVLKALTLRMDYRFGHEYPGGDMGVHDSIFCGIIDDCLTIVGLKPTESPKIHDFADKEEYMQKLLAYENEQNNKIYAFMLETGGMGLD